MRKPGLRRFGAERVVGQGPQGLHIEFAGKHPLGGRLHIAHFAERQAESLQASLGRSPDDAGRDRAQARAHARPDGLLSPGGDLLAHNGVNQSLKEVRHDLTAHRADQLDDFGHALVPRLEVGDFLFAVCKVLRHGNADRGNSPWSTPRAIQSEIALKVKFEKKKGRVGEKLW